MNALKASKSRDSRACVSGMRATRMISESRLPAFPDNILVVGAGDEKGTYILVVVFGDREARGVAA
jgi:hypothetical protein